MCLRVQGVHSTAAADSWKHKRTAKFGAQQARAFPTST